jgi:hypothetical protein
LVSHLILDVAHEPGHVRLDMRIAWPVVTVLIRFVVMRDDKTAGVPAPNVKAVGFLAGFFGRFAASRHH